MTAALAQQQSLLLQALFGNSDQDDKLMSELQAPLATRGLQAYRANGQALAERALASVYPVVAQTMGEESFAPLARYFWHQHPPQRGDMAQWGGELADFLDAAPQLADEPFFGDVARVEWALHNAASSANAATDSASFALLGQLSDVGLQTCPGLYFLASDFPVVSLVNSHLDAHRVTSPSVAQAFELLQGGVREYALVWRQGFKPCVRQSSAGEYALLQALLANQTLEQALDQALEQVPHTADENSECAEFNFNDWLTQSVQQGLVVGAKRCL